MSTYIPTFGVNQINPIYTQAVRDYRLKYSLMPFVTEERVSGKGDPVYFTKVVNSPEFVANAGLGTEVYQQSSYELVSISTTPYTMEFLLPLLDKMLVNIDTVAVELDNVARAIVTKENAVIANALLNATYTLGTNMVNTVTSGTLAFGDLINARNLLRSNGFGMGVGAMALLVGQGSVSNILNDEKLVNTNYITAMTSSPSLNNDANRFAIGAIPSIGLVFEIPEILEDAYLIDIPFALKSLWLIQPRLVQMPSNGLFDGYRAIMDFGVKALNPTAIVKIDITHT